MHDYNSRLLINYYYFFLATTHLTTSKNIYPFTIQIKKVKKNRPELVLREIPSPEFQLKE